MTENARALMLFDGVCNLCSGSVRFVIPRDPGGRIGFAAMQSAAGQAILKRLGLPLTDYETFALLEDGRLYLRSDGVLRLARHMRWPWPLLTVFRLVPRPLRDLAYDWVARNRYRIAGRRDQCFTPTPELAQRFASVAMDGAVDAALAWGGLPAGGTDGRRAP